MKERGRFLPLRALGVVSQLIALACLFSAEVVHADGSSASGQPQYRRPTTRQYNDRLPPVMPGEEIVTETGQKIKTWSSSGPVPVNPRPTPQTIGNGVGGGFGVVVDARDRYNHEGPPDGGGGVQPLAPKRR